MKVAACNPKLGYSVAKIMANHFPEHLAMVLCLNHSPVFQGVWKALKAFLHPNTVAKMHLLRSKQKILDIFRETFPDELTEWLLEEIKLNSCEPLPKPQVEFWKGPSNGEGHDPRGTYAYVKDFVKNSKQGHKPHPNISDYQNGLKQKCVTPKLSRDGHRFDHYTSDLEASMSECSSTEEESEMDEAFAEEYKIPSSAVPFNSNW